MTLDYSGLSPRTVVTVYAYRAAVVNQVCQVVAPDQAPYTYTSGNLGQKVRGGKARRLNPIVRNRSMTVLAIETCLR